MAIRHYHPRHPAERRAQLHWYLLFSLQNPYSLLGGVTTLTLFTLNGALFLGLKITDDLRRRANALAWKVGLVAGVGFLAWTGAAEPEKAGR